MDDFRTNRKAITHQSKNKYVFNEDDDLSPKGRTSHRIVTDWPTKGSVRSERKKLKIKKIGASRLP